MSSNALRMWNEVATLILFAVVFLVVFKDTTQWIKGVVGLIAFAGLLMFAIKRYKKIREKNKQ
jgi:putative membrane protein